MGKLSVHESNVPTVIKNLKDGEWLAPEFQRDFVWNNAAVISLIESIIDAKPIGMVTLWEQEDQSDLQLEHISIPDWRGDLGKTGERYFGEPDKRPGRYFAILDGRQRSTALALAFGGLRAESGTYKHAGKYYLDTTAIDSEQRIKFFTAKIISQKSLDTPSICMSLGLFPLEVSDPDAIHEQWMEYISKIRDPSIYPNGILPDESEINRRDRILRSAFSGIINTKVAIYTVSKEYSLASICEIFETLNTTGTKVSTVDLIHSWVYSDTIKYEKGPLLVRDSIDDLGELDGAVGWASSKDRPELIAQFVAACHVALDNKPTPRPLSGTKTTSISSVKSQDLLAIPSIYWTKIFDESNSFGSFIGDFQQCVGGGSFRMSDCPYPASASIYIALRWFHKFDKGKNILWNREHLDSLFRAFFWRNVLTNRYDQGFLSQVGTDIKDMKEFLSLVPSKETQIDWKRRANAWLDTTIKEQITKDKICDIVSDGSYSGALKRAANLQLISLATKDPIDKLLDIHVHTGNLNLHHIFPKDWCRNNSTGTLSKILNKDYSQRDWINSAANLIPMDRNTNNNWRKQNPGQFLSATTGSMMDHNEYWDRYFVDKECFGYLKQGEVGLIKFWHRRRDLIAQDIYQKTLV